MDFKDIFFEFPISSYGLVEKYNDVLSKTRCRIFYKRFNRNGTYITDEFAEKLVKTLPYTPIKGIYDNFEEDYTDHGQTRSQGRIYGIVPENPNFKWEKHLDEDGIEREYACTDVLLFTGLYEEAGEIINKSQSMELYVPSIKGSIQYIEGRKAYVYEDACFLGLQVLGEDVEPCFEGAAFYSFYDTLKTVIEKIEKYNLSHEDNKGGKTMQINFKLSDSQKHNMIFELLNPSFNEENGWVINYSVCEVYDDYALVINYEEGCYERAYYSKDDSTDSLTINERVKCFVVDVTESEKQTLDTIQKINGGNFEKAEEIYEQVENLEKENIEFEQKIVEKEEAISTLTTEKDEAVQKFEALTEEHAESTERIEAMETELSELREEADNLREFKLNAENAQKEAIIEKYSATLSEEVIADYKAKMGEFTIQNLEKELAFVLVQSTPFVFSNTGFEVIPTTTSRSTGIESILEKYRN